MRLNDLRKAQLKKPEVRKNLFRQALIYIQDKKEDYICSALSLAIRNMLKLDIFPIDIPEMFPEMLKYRPKSLYDSFKWWHVKERDKRIEVLKSMIKDVRKKAE